MHVMLCVMFPLAVVVIGYQPVEYTVNEDVSTGVESVFIRVFEGDLTGITASNIITVDVSAASFTATGLFACLSIWLLYWYEVFVILPQLAVTSALFHKLSVLMKWILNAKYV